MSAQTTPVQDPAPATAPAGIALCEPCLGGREWEYVRECLDSGWVSTAGPFVSRFEAAMAARLGAKHAVATVSGTAALHVALLVAGVAPDDEVLVSTLTFIAPANAIRYLGAHPVFIDAEPR
jgi:perosamine synthetase